MLKNYLIKVPGVFLIITSLTTSVYAKLSADSTANKTTETTHKVQTVVANQETSSLNKYLKSIKFTPVGNDEKFGYENGKKLGLFKNDINVSGTVRFVSIYRNLGDAYADNKVKSSSNISFADYPIVGGGSAAGSSGFPMVDLLFSSKINRQADFIIAYSYSHFMSGIESKTVDNTRFLSNVQNLRIAGNYYTDYGKFSFQAGSILPAKLSKFSMGQVIYRDDYFDRLPWDWYRNSYTRYEEYYGLKNNMGGQNEGRALFYGTMMNGQITPLGINILLVYGRTPSTSNIANIGKLHPAATFGGRIEKTLFAKKVNGKYALNYYRKDANMNNIDGPVDNNSMTTGDFDFQFKGFKLSGEIAYSQITNIVNSNISKTDVVKRDGIGYQVKLDVSKKYIPFPLVIDGYYIPRNVVSLDGSILNTNNSVRYGGITNDNGALAYDGSLFKNVVQEIGQYANNRWGANLKTDFKIGRLSVDLAAMITQEIEKSGDSVVTIQHRVNSFTRSRMNPYFMQAGPYGRVRSIFRRTYENVALTQERDNKKAFNAAEAWIMYKGKLLNKNFIFITYHTYSTSLSHQNLSDNFNNNAYTRQYYTDATLIFKVLSKVALVGNYGFERLMGGKNTVVDEVSGGSINQTGYSYGFGIDYDFLPSAGIHLRHKYFSQKDANFTLDKFNGTETTLEFKYFF